MNLQPMQRVFVPNDEKFQKAYQLNTVQQILYHRRKFPVWWHHKLIEFRKKMHEKFAK